MQDSLGGEPDPADDDRRRSKKDSSFISPCMDKRTKEDCDRGSSQRTRRYSSAETEVIRKTEICRKGFSPERVSYNFTMTGQRTLGQGTSMMGALLHLWHASRPVH